MKNLKWVHSIGRYWFLILIVIVVIWAAVASGNSDSSSSSLPPPVAVPVATVPVDPVSLSTGTILKQRSAYLQGDGTLTVSNGTDGDAVIKLINGGTSVFTVYIKKGDSYNIKNISDGSYRVAFDQGTNWDSATGTFTNDEGSQFFEDVLDYATTDSQYTTYNLTLNPVEGGTAQTNTVNSNQFSQY
jgi:hypothetical protein